MKLTKFLLCTLCMAATFGCGGGGGGGSASGNDLINVSYSPNPLAMTIYQHEPGAKVFLYASLNPLPSGNVYVLLEDSQQVLLPGPVSVTNNGGGSFRADLPIDSSITEGIHQGDFNLVLCKDANCANRYALSDPKISYKLTVEPLITAIIKIDDIAQVNVPESIDSYGARTYHVTVKSGHTIEVDTSKPMDRMDNWSTLNGSAWAVVTQLPGSTLSAWKAVVSLNTPSDTSEFGQIIAQQSSDGETVNIILDVTQ